MSHEVKIHDAQTSILRELLFHKSAGFAQLQKKTNLASDHFNFHIKKLLELGLVEKLEKGHYCLSPRGKEHANKLDTDNNTIERQPKCAVIIAVEKMINGRRHLLMHQRTKHPYFEFWGFPTGKIRWGETIMQTAARELEEETGLSAEFRIAGVYHEHVSSKENDEFLEDKLFFVMHGINPTGELIAEFEGGRNVWMQPSEVKKLEKKYDSVDIELGFIDKPDHPDLFIERHYKYSKQQF